MADVDVHILKQRPLNSQEHFGSCPRALVVYISHISYVSCGCCSLYLALTVLHDSSLTVPKKLNRRAPIVTAQKYHHTGWLSKRKKKFLAWTSKTTRFFLTDPTNGHLCLFKSNIEWKQGEEPRTTIDLEGGAIAIYCQECISCCQELLFVAIVRLSFFVFLFDYFSIVGTHSTIKSHTRPLLSAVQGWRSNCWTKADLYCVILPLTQNCTN